MNLGHVIALNAVPHRDRVKSEHPRQHIHGLLVADRDVQPDNCTRTFEQLRELFNLMSLDTCIADKPHIHTFTAPSASRCNTSASVDAADDVAIDPDSHHTSIQLRARRHRPRP